MKAVNVKLTDDTTMSWRICLILLTVILLLIPKSVSANVIAAGIASISTMPTRMTFQSMGLALIVIILVELLVLRGRHGTSLLDSLKILTLANLFSTFMGYVIGFMFAMPLLNMLSLLIVPIAFHRMLKSIIQKCQIKWFEDNPKRKFGIVLLLLFAITYFAMGASLALGQYMIFRKVLASIYLSIMVLILLLFGIVVSAILEGTVVVSRVSKKEGLLLTLFLMNCASYFALSAVYLPTLLKLN